MPSLAIRVAVVEFQALFAKALCSVFSGDPDINVVGDYRTPIAAQLTSVRPDLVILDIDGQASDVVEIIQTCASAAPGTRVCVLSMRVTPEIMQRCLGAGADAYIVKDISPAELIKAAKSVASGETYVDPRVAGGLLRRRNSPAGRPDLVELSARESEVIKLIAEGLANKQISARLHLSEKTVKNHISRIFSKLNINARTQAAVHAIRTGLV
ncbi:MAG TPA: response regulator transcription factor [Polyangiaceae bacterium]|jgi:two-component system response regulator DevR|nr:response regulator transcription factor [Polyangiaceae bacterium]